MILETKLVFSVGKAGVTYAQEHGMVGPGASRTISEKDKPASNTDSLPEANAVSKTSEVTQTGLVAKFVSDQREIWTSPARVRFTDTVSLIPLSGITADNGNSRSWLVELSQM